MSGGVLQNMAKDEKCNTVRARTGQSSRGNTRGDEDADLVETWLELVHGGRDVRAALALGVTRMTLWRWRKGRVEVPREALARMRGQVERIVGLSEEGLAAHCARLHGVPVKVLRG